MINYRTIVLASVSLLGLSVPAMAQEHVTPPAQANTVGSDPGDIVVTARRRDESKQDVPLVVNQVTAQTLSKLNIRDFKDIQTVVPGLSLTPNANGIGAQSSLRGVNHDVNISGDNGTIQYYLDDAPVGSDIIFQTMYDVGQIEVLRGPQGTLRGRATPSGSITIATHQPDLNRPGAYIDGTIASADARNVNFGIGVPIIEDKLAVRVAGVYDFNRGDRVTSVNNSTQPSNTTKSMRATVRFEPTEWFKSGFSYMTIDHEVTNFLDEVSFSQVDPTVVTTGPSYGILGLSDRKSVQEDPNTFQQNFKRYTWNAQVNALGQSLIYVGSHSDTHYVSRGYNDNAAQFPTLHPFQDTDTRAGGTSHEIRLQNVERLAGIFDYVVGYFQQVGKPVTHLTSASLLQYCLTFTGAPGTTCAVPAGAPSTTTATIDLPLTPTKEQSYFGNLTAHLGNFELAGGLRHIKYTDPGQNLYINCTTAFSACTPTSPATDNSFSKTIYNVTARYRLNDDLMVYASSGSSVRPGAHAIGDFSQIAFSPNEQAHTHTTPETSKSYEVGFKSDWLEKTLQVNVTYYHQNFKNYAYRAPGNGVYYLNFSNGAFNASSFNFISAVPVKVDGVEGEINYRPTRHFSVNLDLNYAKSKIGGAQIACNLAAYGTTPTVTSIQNALAAAGQAGEHLAVCAGGGQSANFSPNFSGTLQSEYSLPVSGRAEAFVRGLLSFRGATPNDPSNPYDDIGSYAIFNGYVGLRDPDGAWALTFYGKNLGNLTRISTLNASPNSISATNVFLAYPTFAFVGTSSSNNVGAYGGVSLIAPREFGVNLRIAFGSH